MIRCLAIIFLLISADHIFGQNIVSNPSFEQLYKANCRWSSQSFSFGASVAFWESANAASPDMHSLLVEEDCWSYAVNSQYADTVTCQPGSQQPRTGNVMAGLITTNDSTGWREYITNRMVEATIPNKLYRVRFYISLADNSAIASNNIGICFSENPLTSDETGVLPYNPQIEIEDIIGDDEDWVEIDTTILASSAWRFLTIGNFRSNGETTTKAHQYCPWAYYYIDDVSVELSEHQTKIPNVFTPNGDGVNDTFRPYLFEPDDVNARVYDRWGRLMYKSNDPFFEWNGESQSGTEAAAGVYFWIINYSDQIGLSYNLRGYMTLIR